jgi:hypothetical protein
MTIDELDAELRKLVEQNVITHEQYLTVIKEWADLDPPVRDELFVKIRAAVMRALAPGGHLSVQ